MVAKRLSYKVKSTPAARDGSALIDLTAVVEDILEAGHEGATLHFSIRAIRKRHHRRSQGRQSHSDSHVVARHSHLSLRLDPWGLSESLGYQSARHVSSEKNGLQMTLPKPEMTLS